MKVKELIKELEKFDQDLEVSIEFSVGYVDIAKPFIKKLWTNHKQNDRVCIIGIIPRKEVQYEKPDSLWKRLKNYFA